MCVKAAMRRYRDQGAVFGGIVLSVAARSPSPCNCNRTVDAQSVSKLAGISCSLTRAAMRRLVVVLKLAMVRGVQAGDMMSGYDFMIVEYFGSALEKLISGCVG